MTALPRPRAGRAGAPPTGGAPALVHRGPWLPGGLALLLLAAPGLEAQGPTACRETVDLQGRVASIEDGSPVVGASVVLPAAQLRVITGADGRFRALGVCPGPVEVSVSHLAFGTTTRTVTAGGGASVELRLAPRAIPLEGVLVEVEPILRHLERRRMAVAYKSGVYNATDFEPHERPSSIPEYVAARTGHPLYSCGGSPLEQEACYPYRGGMKEVTTVCVDSAPIEGELDVLELWPQDDIARLEFYPALGMIKVFTRSFMLEAAQTPWLLQGRLDHC